MYKRFQRLYIRSLTRRRRLDEPATWTHRILRCLYYAWTERRFKKQRRYVDVNLKSQR